MHWQIRDRKLSLAHPLVMGILNVTPDSFSDGGKFKSVETAIQWAECMIAEGAHILDVGGESTRPGGKRVSVSAEISRVVPVIKSIRQRFEVPISIDTSKSEVANAAVDAGADIINDISGLRFDDHLANIAAETGCGLVLMHSRGEFELLHSQPPVEDTLVMITSDLQRAIDEARKHKVSDDQLVLDPGIGFGKTQAQNLELIANLGKLKRKFHGFPLLIGTSRKSFIGKLLNDALPHERLYGSIATAAIAAWQGVNVFRVHDVRETVEALTVIQAIKDQL
jgi:dihydropteroate synthase